MNKCRKNNNRLKKLKLKKRERKKEENATELQKPNVETEVYDNNQKCDREGKKKAQSLIEFLSANKIDNYNGGWREGGEKNSKESTEKVKE